MVAKEVFKNFQPGNLDYMIISMLICGVLLCIIILMLVYLLSFDL